MTTWERVIFTPFEGKRRTAILRNPKVNKGFLTGIEVNCFDDEISGPGFTERLHLIALSAINHRTPLRMENKYAELVPVTGKIVRLNA